MVFADHGSDTCVQQPSANLIGFGTCVRGDWARHPRRASKRIGQVSRNRRYFTGYPKNCRPERAWRFVVRAVGGKVRQLLRTPDAHLRATSEQPESSEWTLCCLASS